MNYRIEIFSRCHADQAPKELDDLGSGYVDVNINVSQEEITEYFADQKKTRTVYVYDSFRLPKSADPEELYKQLAVKLIEQRFDRDDEIAINRQRDTKPNEFKEYFGYCEDCKKLSKRVVGLIR